MRYTYCPDCGEKLLLKEAGDDGRVPYCGHCKKFWFDSFANAVIVMVHNEEGEIALSWQNYLSDKYANFTSGYITPGETAEEAAIREVKEELGLNVQRLDYVGTHWFSPKDMLMHMYLAHVIKEPFSLSSEIDKACWVSAENIVKYVWPETSENPIFPMYREYMKRNKK